MQAPRFSYVKFDNDHTDLMAMFRRAFEDVEARIDHAFDTGRPKSLAMTALEEAYMWVGKAMRDKQVARNGVVDEQPSRNNE